LGISGFRLANTQYLTEDPQLRDESRSILPVEANDYQSLIHIYTRDRPENAVILAKWQEIVHNETNSQGYVFVNDLIIKYINILLLTNMYIIIHIIDYSHCKMTSVQIYCKFTMRKRH